MRKYILISKKNEGCIEYGFNQQGYMVSFRICSWTMDEAAIRTCLEHVGFYLHYDLLRQFVNDRGYALVKIENDLSFDQFWEIYPTKRNKIDSMKLWNRQTPEQRQFTMFNLEAYLRYCKKNESWYNPMYPDTYLGKHYRDDWDKIAATSKEVLR